MTARTQDDIRKDIDETRGDIAAKAAELSDRASAAAQKLRLSHQMDERPFTMLAISVVAGFAAQRILFRSERPVYLMHDEEIEARPKTKKKKKKKARRRERNEDREDFVGEIDERSSFDPMGALGMVGQMAAGMLAREVASRLVGRHTNGVDEHETSR